MKKFLEIALSALGVFSLSANVFAVDLTEINQSDCIEMGMDLCVTADANGTIDPELYGESSEDVEEEIVKITGKESAPTMYVEIKWDEMIFIYDFGTITKYDWNSYSIEYVPVIKYENGECAGWIDDTKDIRFTNFSNREVYVGVYFEKNPDTKVYDNVKISFDDDEKLLNSAVASGAQEKTIHMKIEGKPRDVGPGEDAPKIGTLKFYVSDKSRVH